MVGLEPEPEKSEEPDVALVDGQEPPQEPEEFPETVEVAEEEDTDTRREEARSSQTQMT